MSRARDDALTAATASKIVLTQMTTALDAERAIREKMIAVITPRDLTASQETIKNELSPFSTLRVDILTFGDTKEIADFGRELSEILKLAGWKPKLWSVFNGASEAVTGVPILTRKGAPAVVGAAASALGAALTGQQISARYFSDTPFEGTNLPVGGVKGPPWDEKDAADIRVYIGPKP